MFDFNRVTSQHSIAQVVRHCAIYALNGTDYIWLRRFDTKRQQFSYRAIS